MLSWMVTPQFLLPAVFAGMLAADTIIEWWTRR